MKIIAAIILLVIAPLATGQDLSHWEGHYSGELRSENVSGMVNTFHMELVIEYENDSTYKWVIIYGEEGDSLRQERNYVIRRTSTENHFILDEQNSILLDFDLIGNSFYSIFEVQDNLIIVEYQWHKKEIIFILTSGYGRSETGNSSFDGEEIPIVYSYKTAAVQIAILRQIN